VTMQSRNVPTLAIVIEAIREIYPGTAEINDGTSLPKTFFVRNENEFLTLLVFEFVVLIHG